MPTQPTHTLSAMVLVAGLLSPVVGYSQDASEQLQAAMRVRISVSYNRKAGTAIPAAHCRHAREGCNQRLAEFAGYLVHGAEKHGLDPWLLAAMAARESGYNPFAMGAVGELGILQIHPRSRHARELRFMQDELYRKRCRRKPGACQEEIVERAAQVLADSIRKCGSVIDGLGMYNTGRCGGNDRYAKRVLQERDSLRRSVGLDSTPLPKSGTAVAKRHPS